MEGARWFSFDSASFTTKSNIPGIVHPDLKVVPLTYVFLSFMGSLSFIMRLLSHAGGSSLPLGVSRG